MWVSTKLSSMHVCLEEACRETQSLSKGWTEPSGASGSLAFHTKLSDAPENLFLLFIVYVFYFHLFSVYLFVYVSLIDFISFCVWSSSKVQIVCN